MVKLDFNPAKNGSNGISSKTSKKKVLHLNPFNDFLAIEPKKVTPPSGSISKTSEIVGLDNTLYTLKSWYSESFSDTSKEPLLIIGPTGCGKTSLVELYCQENDIQLYTVQVNDLVRTKKDLIREIIVFSDYSLNTFFVKEKQKKLLLIDEYQNVQNDLLGITDIIQLFYLRTGTHKKELKGVFENEFVKVPPILIISADSKGSKLNELKKVCQVHYIGDIPRGVIFSWASSLFKSINEDVLMELVQNCKSDKRLLLNALSFGKPDPSFHCKDLDLNVFEYIDTLFDSVEPQSVDDIYKVYENYGFTISNLVQENYLDYAESLECIAQSAEALSYSETIFSDTYDSIRNFLPEVHFVNALCIPSYYSRSHKKNKNGIRTNCNNNRFNIYLNNKKTMDKIIFASNNQLDVYSVFYIKKFLSHELIKSKTVAQEKLDFLKNILHTFSSENKIEKLEWIYKYFSEFKDIPNSKTKNFTLKFKEKLNKLNEL